MAAKRTNLVVISGISGRLPECSSIQEFKEKLMNEEDMVTTHDGRSEATEIRGFPEISGKLKDIKYFDYKFFEIEAKQARSMDPHLRLLLEVTYEAIADAGINPSELKGSNTGVFVGSCLTESLEVCKNNLDQEKMCSFTDCNKSMFANRISNKFGLIGPSLSVDSVYSSSMSALQLAINAINLGQCDSAIVAGVNLFLNPNTSTKFHLLNLLSPDGKCKSFDESADGYVRSESIVVILLQKSDGARRIYANVLGVKCYGAVKIEHDIGVPSQETQSKLIREVYAENEIDPTDVVYVEAHGAGTKICDAQELNSITDVFCTSNRKTPLLIGSVKSNMGHSESVAGLCSLVKIVISMESGVIPANRNFKNPNTNVPGLLDGRLKVVTSKQTFNGGLIGVNAFGFGGINSHVILSPNNRAKSQYKEIPRLIMVSGRTKDAVNYFLDKIKEQTYDEEFYSLIDQLHKNNIEGHGYRGVCILGEEASTEIGQVTAEKPPIWFVFSGMDSQWPGMGKDLMKFKSCKESIQTSADVLKPLGIDLFDVILSTDGATLDNPRNSFVAITAIQIALVDFLKLINIEPDGIIGYSNGEIACAYADGTVTSEQAILLAYARGTSILESKPSAGAMAFVRLTLNQFKKRALPDIFMAGHNSENNLTISGPLVSINDIIEELSDEGIFAQEIKHIKIAFHSKYINQAAAKMKTAADDIIPNPKPRSSKWISSSIPEADWDKPWAKLSSAEYQMNNMISPVYFHEATRHIPQNAIVLELAPHASLQNFLRRSLPHAINIGLLKNDHTDNFKYLLSRIGMLYMSGCQPTISKLYESVKLPVSRGTPMISHMIKWDHSTEWTTMMYSTIRPAFSKLFVEIDISEAQYKYLSGCIIDGRVVFPVAGYMVLVWRMFAKLKKINYEKFSVRLENIKFLKPIILPKEGSIKIFVNISEGGIFEITQNGWIITTGRIYENKSSSQDNRNLSYKDNSDDNHSLPLYSQDIYKEFNLRGYNYKGSFKGIINSDHLGISGNLKWENNWVTFIETMLQFSILGNDNRNLILPNKIHKLVINPNTHFNLDSHQVPIDVYKNNNIIKSGGVEIRGLTTRLMPRYQKSESPLKLETYQFVPLENNISLAPNTVESVNKALAVASQLVLENIEGNFRYRIVEISIEHKSYILPEVKEIFEDESMIYVDGTVISPKPIDDATLKDKFIQVYQKDVTAAPFAQNAHLVILTCTLLNKHHDILANAVLSLQSGGFILFREPKNKNNTDTIKNHSLTIVYQQVTEDEMFILARKSEDILKNPIVITITDSKFDWIETLKKAFITNVDEKSKIYLICQGEEISGLVGLVNCIKKEPGGLNVRSIFIQDSNAEPFSITSNYYKNQLEKDLTQNVLKKGVWGTYRHLSFDQACKDRKRPVEHACLNFIMGGDLSNIQWIESPVKIHTERENSRLCNVYYAALNIKDMMLATSQILPDALGGTIGQDGSLCMGMEFSGRDSKGRRVMGFIDNSISTTVVSEPNYLWKIPETWSLEEAATIPLAYSTSYYALIIRGKIKSGDSILIHSGCGAIGQASISIALYMGCVVFTTVVDKVQRDFIKKRFPQLQDDHIGISQDTTFEQMIQNQTRQRGVDLVLNSLSGEKLEASIRCLAHGGRFLEIGQENLLNDFSLDLSGLKNITYHGIILDSFNHMSHADRMDVNRLVSEGIANGVVKPLPASIFLANQIKDAFRYLASESVINKVLLKLRDEEKNKTSYPSRHSICAVPKTYLDPEKVYVLVGGLGGIGLEVTNWLITRGARKIILNSRHGIKTGYQFLCINRWKKQNVKIQISTVDLTTMDGAMKFINDSKDLGPIGGIFNLASILKDDFMKNQTEENFKLVCKPKIDITKNLDAVSRTLTSYLDYFVVFSSISSGRGISMQANYGYANSSIERICKNRQANGLPALAIQWSYIGDTGFLADAMNDAEEITEIVFESLSSCLSTLDFFLQQKNSVVSSTVVPKVQFNGINLRHFKLINNVANILQLQDNKVTGGNTLAELGMDPLMCYEIKRMLDLNYGFILNETEIRVMTFEDLAKLDNIDSCSYTSDPEGGRLMPIKSCIKMVCRESSKMDPIFMIHPVEGVVDALYNIAREIQAPVYGLQCTTAAPLTSIIDLAGYYVQKIKKVQKNGPYKLIGYSFGAFVTFEVAVQLELLNENVKLYLVDGSPEYMLSQVFTKESTKYGHVISEQTDIVLFFLNQFIPIDRHKRTREFLAMKSYKERVNKLIELVHSVSIYPPEEIREALMSFYRKTIISKTYKPTAVFKGELMLVRLKHNYMDINEDYGLKAICKQKFTIKTLEGTHQSIVNHAVVFEFAKLFAEQV